MPMTKMRFTVAFDESDSEGIVFFGNYFRLAHRALERWLTEREIPWAQWFKNPEFGVPLRHVEADYLRPLRPGESFDATIQVDEIGDSSVHFSYEFTSPEGTPLARLKTSHVFVTRGEMKKMKIPDLIRECLTR